MDNQLDLYEDLLFAVSSGDYKKVEELIDVGADIHFVDELSKSALHYAVENDHRQLVHFLLSKGADVNAHLSDSAGDTPITIAAYQGHYAISKLLLKAGANPYISAWMGNDALDYALRHEAVDGKSIKELIIKMHPSAKCRKYCYK